MKFPPRLPLVHVRSCPGGGASRRLRALTPPALYIDPGIVVDLVVAGTATVVSSSTSFFSLSSIPRAYNLLEERRAAAEDKEGRKPARGPSGHPVNT